VGGLPSLQQRRTGPRPAACPEVVDGGVAGHHPWTVVRLQAQQEVLPGASSGTPNTVPAASAPTTSPSARPRSVTRTNEAATDAASGEKTPAAAPDSARLTPGELLDIDPPILQFLRVHHDASVDDPSGSPDRRAAVHRHGSEKLAGGIEPEGHHRTTVDLPGHSLALGSCRRLPPRACRTGRSTSTVRCGWAAAGRESRRQRSALRAWLIPSARAAAGPRPRCACAPDRRSPRSTWMPVWSLSGATSRARMDERRGDTNLSVRPESAPSAACSHVTHSRQRQAGARQPLPSCGKAMSPSTRSELGSGGFAGHSALDVFGGCPDLGRFRKYGQRSARCAALCACGRARA
jgi:hypothetical protein